MSDSIAAPGVIVCFARVSAVFADLASWLRSQDDISCVTNPVWFTSGDRESIDRPTGQIRVQWFADAELVSGRAISFGIELVWVGGEWLIEPGLRVNDDQGQDDLLDLATRFAVDDSEMCDELVGAAQAVADVREKALAAARAWSR